MDLILWRHAEAEDGPASSEQGSLGDANVRESGPVPSGASAAPVESENE
ncbi:MAG TPA: hypothetical protein VMT94_01060 [Burkholderiales bacterium]|nr:hypothetical protein [Burkholderiales bacterium]